LESKYLAGDHATINSQEFKNQDIKNMIHIAYNNGIKHEDAEERKSARRANNAPARKSTSRYRNKDAKINNRDHAYQKMAEQPDIGEDPRREQLGQPLDEQRSSRKNEQEPASNERTGSKSSGSQRKQFRSSNLLNSRLDSKRRQRSREFGKSTSIENKGKSKVSQASGEEHPSDGKVAVA